eukprot:SAG31_NODE_19905_length_588_cov_2.014315_2_plen_59_part_01
MGFSPGFMSAAWEVWTDHVQGACGGSWSLPPETAVLTGMGVAAGGTRCAIISWQLTEDR